jgi:hypothetical protein
LDGIVTVDADFACMLERELNAANERIKRLEEVLDEVYHAGRVGASLRAEKAWRKAKEAKL